MAYENDPKYIVPPVRKPKDLLEDFLEALRTLAVEPNDIYHQWRRTGNVLDLLTFTDEGEASHRELNVESLSEEHSDALEYVVTFGAMIVELLETFEREGFPFGEEQIEEAAKEKFCRDYPLGRREAEAHWRANGSEILHGVNKYDPYQPGSRYEEALAMLIAAGGTYVEER